LGAYKHDGKFFSLSFNHFACLFCVAE